MPARKSSLTDFSPRIEHGNSTSDIARRCFSALYASVSSTVPSTEPLQDSARRFLVLLLSPPVPKLNPGVKDLIQSIGVIGRRHRQFLQLFFALRPNPI